MTQARTGFWPIRSSLQKLSFSPSLLIHEHVFSLRRQGRTVYHMALEESPFPVHPVLQERLNAQIAGNAYLPSVGLFELKTLACQYFTRHLGIPDLNYQVIIGPGCSELVQNFLFALEGDLLFPVPSWINYCPHTLLMEDAVVKLYTDMETGYKLTPAILEKGIKEALLQGRKPTKLFLNYPNDPSGSTYSGGELDGLARVAKTYGILVISDESFGLVNYAGNHESISRYYPEGTVVVAGLSRHLSLGGFRFAVGIIPENMERLFQTMRSLTGETAASAASPLQYGVLSALMGNSEIEAHIHVCTDIHQVISRYMCRKLNGMGVAYPRPEGAFFLYPDFSPFSGTVGRKYGVSSSEALAESLLLERQVAALPGTAFGDRNEDLRLRLSILDYNGKSALDYYEKFGLVSEDHFIEACCPRIEEGIRRIGQYFLD
ncbi:MAG: aminotransferase class I/II-fold pyridoxal phosphate-dependent enzyme [Spirochaetales bacterium]|nr:aminotransferase class I/II-fold pyridoxal phosphate-dependent enzyme [Spirochaetales bacterium]